ncbi:hypothetical protein HYY27_02570 [bacterium]|nr:hypothetical protein [bacterium]
MSEPILAGFGRVDITPERDPAFEILDPIYFRALHVRQGGRQVTFLAADLFALDDRFRELLAGYLRGTDVDPDWVLRGACHLGTGPTLFQYYVNQPTEALKQFGQDERYATAGAEAIRLAVADLAPARAAVGTGEVEAGLQYNRRAHDEQGRLHMVSLTQYPQPPGHLRYDAVDRQVGVMRFDREGRRPVALVNFGCHALSLWDRRGNISGDFPGRMAERLAQEGIEALFFEGALGNVHPVRQGDDPCGRIAQSLTKTVLKVFRSLRPPAEVDIKFLTKTIDLAPQPVGEVEAARRRWEAQPARSEGLARYQYWLAQRYQGAPSYPFTLHLLTVGRTALLHAPGEPFVETARAIREAAPFERVLLLADPCPEAGYLPTPEAHREGGDEPQFAALEAQAEAKFRRAAIELLKEAAQEGKGHA